MCPPPPRWGVVGGTETNGNLPGGVRGALQKQIGLHRENGEKRTGWSRSGRSHRAPDCPEVLGEPATKDAKPGSSVIHEAEAVLTGASGRSADNGGREAGRGPGQTQWAFIMVGSGKPGRADRFES